MNKKLSQYLKEERFKPFKGKIVGLFDIITLGGGDKFSYIYHVESEDGAKWAVTFDNDPNFKVGAPIKVTKKMRPRKFHDNKFPKLKHPAVRT